MMQLWSGCNVFAHLTWAAAGDWGKHIRPIGLHMHVGAEEVRVRRSHNREACMVASLLGLTLPKLRLATYVIASCKR